MARRSAKRPARRIPTALSTRVSPLARLHAIRHRYSATETDEKLALIARLERTPPRSARGLVAYHDDLLFLRAFPDNLRVLTAAVRGLAHTAARVHALAPAQRRRLDDTGMAGTSTRHAFAFGIARWLIANGEDAEIDWEQFEQPDRLDPLLRLSLTQAEADAFDSGEISTKEWLAQARGGGRRGALAWIAHPRGRKRAPAGAPDDAVVRLLYESLEIPIRWRLSASRATSGNAIAGVTPTFRQAMRPSPADPATWIETPLPTIERLTTTDAARWLDASRAALATRCREVHAITYANLDEVYRADLGEGAALCLIGAARDDRLTLEANYGYVLFSNGVPVGYGGVTPLASQANTGVNIFDAFRHAEAAMLFAQALRAFRTLFGITRFIVNPYQFGAGNDEALASGAFWFYDRLGFRPVQPAVEAIAARERALRIASRTHRTSAVTLRRLAAGDLVLELPGAADTPLFEERWLVTLARAVTDTLAAPDATARLTRRDDHLDDVARALGVRQWRTADAGTRFGMQRLAPIVALILEAVTRWPSRERRALVQLFKAKGGEQERGFAVAAQTHRPLWEALRQYCLATEHAGT